MRASMKTVAQAAGVSVSSVSNAYNKPEQLSAEVRERILAVAQEQGYAGPDATARSLRGKRSGAIGVLLDDRISRAFSDPYLVEFLAGIAESAESTRSGILLVPVAPLEPGNAAAMEASIEAARQAVIDGVAVYCVDPEHPARKVFADRGLPIVASKAYFKDQAKTVLTDDLGDGRKLGRLIRRLGHRDVAIITDSHEEPGTVRVLQDGPSERIEAPFDRLIGYLEGLGKGLHVTLLSGGSNARLSGSVSAAELLDRSVRPSAIICISDLIALGVMDALRQRGLVVGRDVSVTGFDDIPEAEPAGLTTVRQPIREKGRLMGRMLLDPDYPESSVLLPTTLVVRSSTGPAQPR